MSSTGRGSERVADDFYETPGWVTRAIVPHLGPLEGRRILEPSAGRGAIVRELLRAGADNHKLVRVERDEARADALLHDAPAGAMQVVLGDFLSVPIGTFDVITMNPPFSAAQEHVEHALSLLAPGGRCAALLRLAWCTGAKRAPFRKRYPFSMFPLASRPSFTAEALGWMTDDDLASLARTFMPKATTKNPNPVERIETIVEVRSRLKGTDSADYCWFVWERSRDDAPRKQWLGGTFEVLEKTKGG
jgi:hypothetical protein